jgi:hypothetical protein
MACITLWAAKMALGLAPGLLFAQARMQVREGLPILDGVYVNGHGPCRFLLDTGTNVNLIDEDLAQSIGLTGTFRTELASAAGVTVVPGGDGIRVAVDAVEADGQKFLFLPLEAIHKRWPDVQGVLGQWFLSRFDYLLDLRGGRLEFRKQDRNGTRAHFTMMNGRPIVATSLGDLVLDSAAARLVLFGVEPNSGAGERSVLRTVAGSREVGMVFGKALSIEGRRIWRGEAVAVPRAAESGVGGLLPLSLFKAIYFCNSEHSCPKQVLAV